MAAPLSPTPRSGEPDPLQPAGGGAIGVAEQRGPGRRAPARGRGIPLALWGVFFGLAALIPVIDGNPSHIDTLVYACSYAILALGLNIVVGYAGLLDLGYAAFYAIGAYAFGMIGSAQFLPPVNFDLHIGPIDILNVSQALGIHANFWIFLPIIALVAALFGVILGAPTLRLRGDYLAIVTLGFGEIVPDVIRNLPSVTGGENSLAGIDQPTLGAVQFTNPPPWYYLSLVVLAVVVIISSRLRGSRLGRAWIAIREDEVAASCMGINLTRTKLMAFGMGAFFSGFAGMIIGSYKGSISPEDFTFEYSISFLCMVVLGGMGSIPGVIVGAVFIALLQFTLLDQATSWVHSLGNLTHIGFLQTVDLVGARYLIFGIILVVMMIFLREGIVPGFMRFVRWMFRRAGLQPDRRHDELYPDDAGTLQQENQQLYDVRNEKSTLRG